MKGITRYYGFGINDYPDRANDLNGCVNDIILSRNVLKGIHQLSNDYIHLRTNGRATLAAYREKMRHAAAVSQPGDRVIFWNSSHGTQIPDRDGDEISDKLDECIVPHDFESKGFLVDDEIAAWLKTFRDGVGVVLIFDCCFSGTVARTFYGTPQVLGDDRNRAARTVLNRTLVPSIDYLSRVSEDLVVVADTAASYSLRIANAARLKLAPMGRDGLGTLLPANMVALSASTDYQTASDAYLERANNGKGAFHGIFSWALCETLHKSNGDITYTEIIAEVRSKLMKEGFTQKPTFEGGIGMEKKTWAKW